MVPLDGGHLLREGLVEAVKAGHSLGFERHEGFSKWYEAPAGSEAEAGASLRHHGCRTPLEANFFSQCIAKNA